MKKNVLIFGSIAGIIVSAFMVYGTTSCVNNPDFESSMILGYTAMLVAFAFVFVGVKNYRDKYNSGLITFGKALSLGLLITLVASTFYVVTWLIEYYVFIPDFMDKYSAYMIKTAESSGASPAELETTLAEMDKYKELYKNPVFVVLFTYMEILPIGILASLVSALVFKRKVKVA